MNTNSYFSTKWWLNSLIVFFILSNGSIMIANHVPSGFSQALNANLKNLSNNLGNSTDPQIALYQNNVYVIWTDQSTGNGDIYFKRSIDNGNTFGSIENLSNNPGNSTSPIITVSQSAVYIIWTDQSTGNGDIYFKRSIDNGTTFGSVNNLSNNTGSSSSPQIAASGSNLYTIWVDTSSGSSEIYYRQSLDQGSEFTGIKILSKTRSVDGEHASAPKIYASGNNVYATWQDRILQNNEVFFRSSLDAGSKFTGIKNLSRNNTGDSISPRLAAIANNVFVGWSDTSSGKSEIFLRASTDGGNRFGGLKNVSWSPGSSYDPEMALVGNNLYILWEDNSQDDPTFALTFRSSYNAGQNFADKQNLARYIGESSDYGQIVAEADRVYIVWSENPRYIYPPQYEIFFKMSRDNGTHFDDGINLSNNEVNSIDPHIAVSSIKKSDNGNNNTVFVVWSDNFRGNSDIHFTMLDNLP